MFNMIINSAWNILHSELKTKTQLNKKQKIEKLKRKDRLKNN